MIVDASIAFKWIATEPDSDLANRLLIAADVTAPTLLLIEVGNGLWKKACREQIDGAVSFSDEVRNLSRIVTIIEEAEYVPRALELARELNHAIYDCVYLAMAEAREDVVVTADAKFISKLAATNYSGLVVSLQDAVL
jgi:predicted nucleic acid-binding protein